VAQGYKDIKDISVFVKFETQNTKHETKFQDPNSKIQINSPDFGLKTPSSPIDSHLTLQIRHQRQEYCIS
jgi:hypothetical protein